MHVCHTCLLGAQVGSNVKQLGAVFHYEDRHCLMYMSIQVYENTVVMCATKHVILNAEDMHLAQHACGIAGMLHACLFVYVRKTDMTTSMTACTVLCRLASF